MSENDEDFAALFEASLKQTRIARGQTIEGTIVAIGPEVAFVNVGAKGEAMMALDELRDADGALEAAVGDRIQAVVVSTEGGLTLSRKLARAAASDRQIADAYRAGLPVEGKVERAVKGGYEIRVGRSRAFCPLSQIDARRDTDPATHIGRVYTFRIIEYKDGGRNLVVSRRALVEEEQRASAAALRQSIVEGAVMTGRVSSVREFGAFVELGPGVEGLLPISEMSWSRVPSAAAVVAAGDAITVKVLRVDDGGQKITLGLKQLSDDPWSKVQTTYAIGQAHEGRVTRLAEFGAFVELEPGVEGLAHASTFPPGQSGAWRRLVSVGASAPFEIVSLDLAAKRIGLALVHEGRRGAAREAEDVKAYAERQASEPGAAFGSLADKLRQAIKPPQK